MGRSTGGAFLERGGVLTDLGALPGGAFTVAFALNSRDQVVGYAFGIGNGVGPHAFLYDAQLDPPMQDLNDLIPPDSGIVLDSGDGNQRSRRTSSASGQCGDSSRRSAPSYWSLNPSSP